MNNIWDFKHHNKHYQKNQFIDLNSVDIIKSSIPIISLQNININVNVTFEKNVSETIPLTHCIEDVNKPVTK